jgi:twitching motility protein PilJ
MASGTNYLQEYEQAEKAYISGNFDKAATIIDTMAEEFPEDPNVLLLRGHIYCHGFHDYELARQHYESVLKITDREDLLDFARRGIEQVRELNSQTQESKNSFDEFESSEMGNSELGFTERLDDEIDIESELANGYFGLDDLDLNSGASRSDRDAASEKPSYQEQKNPFDRSSDSFSEFSIDEETDNPFASDGQNSSESYKEDVSPLNSDRPSAFEGETFLESNDNDDEDITSFDRESWQNVDFNSSEDDDEFQIDTLLTEPFANTPNKAKSGNEDTQENWQQSPQKFDSEDIDSSFFELADIEQELPDTGLFNTSMEMPANDLRAEKIGNSGFFENDNSFGAIGDDSTVAPNFSGSNDGLLEPSFENQKGALAKFRNSPLRKKQLIIASAAGIVSALAVTVSGFVLNGFTPKENRSNPIPLALIAGATGFGTSFLLGKFLSRQVELASRDIQNQFELVYQGNLDAKATAYAQDEMGQLALGFNRMMRVILTTTNEAQRRAEETEQAKEDLQRQVIRLLDDVEGAARGDLTVQATVTADVLGAVADAFNLTIQSLREIVRQVKVAAEQVNKSSTASEEFARNQSSDALRMAEELAVTLNSVQMMTESIERVAENAREAEEVARTSSVTALKGGQAVERTVAGIFQIRETVSETARKVKRLAEASQEISKIVLLISQIAERTNQLALNASIQAAKAGEAGRGFAVVADEVRQLADRSAKSLKEIEQIVLQIQSETGSVMTAMEEGIQEVIDVTNRAEQAKRALEDIIQVSNRIDTLVRSITADTVEQRENSRAVAQVMQSVELTAQETSQESQKVAGSLQNLVSIARNLLSSVERFRIDQNGENEMS